MYTLIIRLYGNYVNILIRLLCGYSRVIILLEVLAVHDGNIPQEEVTESLSRLSATVWPVDEDYILENGYIFPAGFKSENIKTYLPLGRLELPGEFAKLHNGTDADVLNFVKRYGMLDYNLRKSDKQPSSNSIAWIYSHAAAVWMVMKLAEALSNPQKLKQELERVRVTGGILSGGNDENYISCIIPNPTANNLKSDVWVIQNTDEEIKEAAARIVTTIINKNIEGVTRQLRYEWMGKEGITTTFKFHNLLDRIYWMLADAVTGGQVKICNYCGKPFLADEDRSRYCRPLLWEKVSRCMNRAKQKTIRKKNKAVKLFGTGLDISEIAIQLGYSVEQIEEWVSNASHNAQPTK